MTCLEETLAHYMAAAVTYARGINDAFLKRMGADHADICDFFERFCIKEKARARACPCLWLPCTRFAVLRWKPGKVHGRRLCHCSHKTGDFALAARCVTVIWAPEIGGAWCTSSPIQDAPIRNVCIATHVVCGA